MHPKQQVALKSIEILNDAKIKPAKILKFLRGQSNFYIRVLPRVVIREFGRYANPKSTLEHLNVKRKKRKEQLQSWNFAPFH